MYRFDCHHVCYVVQAPLTESVGPVEAWGAQAWMKTADDDCKSGDVTIVKCRLLLWNLIFSFRTVFMQ